MDQIDYEVKLQQLESIFDEKYVEYSNQCKQISEEIYQKIVNQNFGRGHNYLLYRDNMPIYLDETYLYLGIIRNNIRVVEHAIFNHENTSILSQDGRNTISYAVDFADLTMIKLLVENGFSVITLNGMKSNPIISALDLKKNEIAEYLLINLETVSLYHYNQLEKYFHDDKKKIAKLKMIKIDK